MHPVLNHNQYFVREQVGFFKASNSYDVFDPNTQQQILQCREEKLGFFTKLLRFTDYKRLTPFEAIVRTPAGEPVIIVRRGVSLFVSSVQVLDNNGQLVGTFKQPWFSFFARFKILGADGQEICQLKGNWRAWDFTFLVNNQEIAKVSKQWGGLAKELFTSADNYMLNVSPTVPPDHPLRQLILAAVLCIDLVLKE